MPKNKWVHDHISTHIQKETLTSTEESYNIGKSKEAYIGANCSGFISFAKCRYAELINWGLHESIIKEK